MSVYELRELLCKYPDTAEIRFAKLDQQAEYEPPMSLVAVQENLRTPGEGSMIILQLR